MSEHDKIIAETREKYTVHNCNQCEFRKSCVNKFDSDECKKIRQSIMFGFGIEDGYFTKLLDRLGAAHKREIETSRATSEKSSAVGNAAKMREALKYLRDASREFCHRILNSKYNQIYDKYKCKEVVKIGDAIVNANIALAASPRNCDVYRTKKERNAAYKKYREYVIMSNSNPFIAQDERMSKEDWLFPPNML